MGVLVTSNGGIAQLVEQRTENPCVPGSSPGPATFLPIILYDGILVKIRFGGIAQLVEQRTENPCVPGSSPGPATSPFKIILPP